jgi:hypothetical protein
VTVLTRNRLAHFAKSRHWQLALVLLLALLARLPFLNAGYGVNVDAWRVARTAAEIARTGEYSVSRFPGYPVQEIVCSWFWRGGPLALNGLSALFSVAAVAAVVLIGRKLQHRDSWLLGLALSTTPIFFVSSVCAKDYIWALTFELLSFLCALRARALLAGILLGLGTGCRITTLAMALPLTLILVGETVGRARWRSILKFVCATAAAAGLAFSPVWLRYGTSFLTFYENHARPDWLTVLARGTVEIWGIAGLIGLLIAAGSLFLKPAKSELPNKWIVPACLLAIVIYITTYLRLPDQAGYLLPIVPFILLLLQRFAPRKGFQVLCACLLISPFVGISRDGLSDGPIIVDHTERILTMTRIHRFLAYSAALPGCNTFVVGGWEPQIAVMAPNLLNARNHYVYLLNEQQLSVALRNSDHVFYLPLMREFNFRVYSLDLAQYGALDLHAMSGHEQVGAAKAR